MLGVSVVPCPESRGVVSQAGCSRSRLHDSWRQCGSSPIGPAHSRSSQEMHPPSLSQAQGITTSREELATARAPSPWRFVASSSVSKRSGLVNARRPTRGASARPTHTGRRSTRPSQTRIRKRRQESSPSVTASVSPLP